MTVLLLTIGALYAASWCVVAILLTRVLWRERTMPLADVVVPDAAMAVTSTTTLEVPKRAEGQPAAKSA